MLLFHYTFVYVSVLLLVALGGMFSERSGIINLSLEGTMVVGGFAGCMTLSILPVGMHPIFIILITLLISILSGAIFSLLLAVAAINFKADQTLVGTALNMFAIAVVTVIVKAYNNFITHGLNSSARIEYIENRKVFLYNIGSFEFDLYLILAVVLLFVSYFVLYKTQFGMHLMACGEHPQAADSVGINVAKMRYIGVMISGCFGGLGGLIYVAAVNSSWDFSFGVAGAGFLALAVMIFGQWKPFMIAGSALIFGFFRAVADSYIGFDFLVNLCNGEVYKMLPYIICLIVLIFTSKNSKAPKAEGIPYDKGMR